ncbi:MAG TPA: hypothetical protein VN259_04775 [Xanthomonadales bacterium]|nr:hypothetical protein [Xanthomonadales bacterium]
MRRPVLAILPLCLLLSACAPDSDSNSKPAPTVAPVVAPTPEPAAKALPAADDHAHHHDAAVGVALERPPGGGNWPTDAALRQGMETIHVALAAALPTFERGELTAPAATTLAGVVSSQVQFLIANCKLEPDADAQLHILIGQMMSAAEAMLTDPAAADGVPKLHAAVQLYGDYFEHPGLHDHTGEPHHADGEASTAAPDVDQPGR